MTNTELMANVAALKAHNLTALFERIADTYRDGLVIDVEATRVLVEAGLVRRRGKRAFLTEAGWSVSTRIAALECARSIAAHGASPYRS